MYVGVDGLDVWRGGVGVTFFALNGLPSLKAGAGVSGLAADFRSAFFRAAVLAFRSSSVRSCPPSGLAEGAREAANR